MDAGLQDYFRERLLRYREELKRRLAGIERDGLAVPMREAIGELSLYDNHPADVASELFERSKDLSLKEDAALKLRAIEDALAKMATGRYGFCDVCGAPIPPERLEAVPYTTMCASCKEKQEGQGGLRAKAGRGGALKASLGPPRRREYDLRPGGCLAGRSAARPFYGNGAAGGGEPGFGRGC
ncbi:TraR/DksA C4-type zinc finger protein [Thermodesulfitimonas sp.]